MWILTPESSNIVKWKYEETTLTVEFKGGAQYQYLEVPQRVIDVFEKAESAGSYLNKRIKGTYEFVKV